MKHFTNTIDWSQSELQQIIDMANKFKQGMTDDSLIGRSLKGKSIGLLFFNPSMRTRTSFELGAWQLGGHAVVLEPGKSAWPIEFEVGKTMDGLAEEHVIEVAKVLSRYCDMICVRAFPKFDDWQVDRQDLVIKAFAKYATVPVIKIGRAHV